MKRTIEIDDSLHERVETACEEVYDAFTDWLKENQDATDIDDWWNGANGCDTINEAADSNTPIYYSDINALYYLYGDEADEAYESRGFGDGKEDNYRPVAIYCLLEERVQEYYNDTINALFKAWKEERAKESPRTIEAFLDEYSFVYKRN